MIGSIIRKYMAYFNPYWGIFHSLYIQGITNVLGHCSCFNFLDETKRLVTMEMDVNVPMYLVVCLLMVFVPFVPFLPEGQ